MGLTRVVILQLCQSFTQRAVPSGTNPAYVQLASAMDTRLTDLLFGGSFLENDTDTPSSYLISPIIESQGILLYEGNEDCTASVLSAASTAELFATSSAELPATGTEDLACVKKLVVKVLPPTLAEKEAKSFAVKNVPKVMLASMDSFKSNMSKS